MIFKVNPREIKFSGRNDGECGGGWLTPLVHGGGRWRRMSERNAREYIKFSGGEKRANCLVKLMYFLFPNNILYFDCASAFITKFLVVVTNVPHLSLIKD